MKHLTWLLMAVLLSGCLGMPDTIKPVDNFELNKYLGTWYEVARLDHSFERGLSKVSAQYTLNDDGSVRVINRGYDKAADEWKEAEGKARFVDDEDIGYLKVSFFGPFYGSYIVFELDHEGYQYAFISGPNETYLWFLARDPNVEPALYERFVALAKEKGFDSSKLIKVEH